MQETGVTESEWLTCRTPRAMFPALAELVSERKVRLYATACCRRVGDRLHDTRSLKAVLAAEAFADGQLDAAELATIYRAAQKVYHELSRADSADSSFALAAAECARPSFLIAGKADLSLALGQAVAVYADNPKGNPPVELLRELFGNPFRQANLDPAWVTEDVRQLAQQMYEARNFTRMPHLGELLRAAGCTDTEILTHCTSRSDHVCGCWLIDLLLGMG